MTKRNKRAPQFALALAIALSAAVVAPVPALAQAGGQTDLTVEQSSAPAGATAGQHEDDQQRETVAGTEKSPQTGDDTIGVPLPAIVAGAVACVAGASLRRRQPLTAVTETKAAES